MAHLPSPLTRLIETLAELPSIGPRQATRLAFHLASLGQNAIRGLSEQIRGLEQVKVCTECFFVHANAGMRCDICTNPARNRGVIAVIEKETDLLSLERAKHFSGTYLILGDMPKNGALEASQKLRIATLIARAQKEFGGKIDEVVLALNPTSNGDFHASLLAKELGSYAKKISRLGKGLPSGGEIEFADNETLGSALERRD